MLGPLSPSTTKWGRRKWSSPASANLSGLCSSRYLDPVPAGVGSRHGGPIRPWAHRGGSRPSPQQEAPTDCGRLVQDEASPVAAETMAPSSRESRARIWLGTGGFRLERRHWRAARTEWFDPGSPSTPFTCARSVTGSNGRLGGAQAVTPEIRYAPLREPHPRPRRPADPTWPCATRRDRGNRAPAGRSHRAIGWGTRSRRIRGT